MNALSRLEKLPDWPARMTAPVAAAYMGLGESTFIARYRDIARKEGGNTFWARAQLDRLIAEQFDLVSDAPAPPVDPYDAWKRGQGA